MFEGWLGSERFRQGVVSYLKAHAWGNATGSDLWTALSKTSGEDINAPMESFLNQAGVPLVTVLPLGEGRVRILQQRLDSAGGPGDGTLWQVPVILAYPAGGGLRTQRVWLRDSAMTVTLEGGASPRWINPNAGASGYYAWNLPPGELAAMAADHDRLPAIDRVGYLRNLPLLLRAGLIHADDYVERVRAFRDDPEPEVTQAAITALESLREPLVSPALEAPFAAAVRGILTPALDRIGLEPRAHELPAISLLRPRLLLALGDMGRDPMVRAWADSTARTLLSRPGAVESWRGEAALPLAAMRGDAAMFARLRERFEAASVPAERSLMLTALGNVRDPGLVEQALEYALSGPLRPQEVYQLPEALATYPPNREAIYHWWTGHFSEVLTRIPGHMMTRMMPALRGCAPERIDAARQFFSDPAHTFPAARFAVARVGDAVGDCVRLHDRDENRFEHYLEHSTASP
jgi:hypothetical protein